MNTHCRSTRVVQGFEVFLDAIYAALQSRAHEQAQSSSSNSAQRTGGTYVFSARSSLPAPTRDTHLHLLSSVDRHQSLWCFCHSICPSRLQLLPALINVPRLFILNLKSQAQQQPRPLRGAPTRAVGLQQPPRPPSSSPSWKRNSPAARLEPGALTRCDGGNPASTSTRNRSSVTATASASAAGIVRLCGTPQQHRQRRCPRRCRRLGPRTGQRCLQEERGERRGWGWRELRSECGVARSWQTL